LGAFDLDKKQGKEIKRKRGSKKNRMQSKGAKKKKGVKVKNRGC